MPGDSDKDKEASKDRPDSGDLHPRRRHALVSLVHMSRSLLAQLAALSMVFGVANTRNLLVQARGLQSASGLINQNS